MNIDKTKEIIEGIAELLENPITFENLLAAIFDKYQLTMTLQQNVLIGSTVKSYLAYLKEEGLAGYFFEDNRMLWTLVKEMEGK